MKILITTLGLVNGGYMLLDGIYVMLNGRYIGPPKPGPWAELFYALGINVFALGPLFVVYGVLWLGWLYALWSQRRGAYAYGLLIAALTLWYLPVGTLLSLVIITVLLTSRKRLAL